MERNNVPKLSLTYSYDALNRLEAVWKNGENTPLVTYDDWDANNNLLEMTTASGVVTTNTFNELNLMSSTAATMNSTLISGFDYSFNDFGCITNVIDGVAPLGTNGITYDYDSLLRVNAFEDQNAAVSHEYLYDKKNNLIFEDITAPWSNWSTQREYDAANRIITNPYDQPTCDPNGNYKYEYTTWPSTGAVILSRTFDYDAYNRLVGENHWVEYTYRADGLLHEDGDNYLVWDGADIVMTVNKWNGDETLYYRGLTLIAFDDPNGDRYYYHHNAKGDVVAISDEYGDRVIKYSYDPYGVLLDEEYDPYTISQSVLDNPFRYCGEYYAISSDLIYLRARFYSPEMRRFLNEDPARSGNNWFAYCSGNPVMLTDPWGLQPGDWGYDPFEYRPGPEDFLTGPASVFATGAFDTDYVNSLTGYMQSQNSGAVAVNVFDLVLRGLCPQYALYSVEAEIKKDALREFWAAGAQLILRDYFGYYFAAALLDHSLQDNPSHLHFGYFSYPSLLIASSPEVNDLIDKSIANSKYGSFTFSDHMTFPNGNLYYALKDVDIAYNGMQQADGSWRIAGTVKDKYDFTQFATLMASEGGGYSSNVGLGTIANDAALVSQLLGVIVWYYITIDFLIWR